ncbi:MAG: dipeptide/oligopeptide/nickel ABC transporter ATP-binding protein [Thermomicrobiales bacterium]|nr:MAG: dipeptide/oligopeptide/nickel ABC transporter ATP-binding protein [Thermomicrobiales bacterium]
MNALLEIQNLRVTFPTPHGLIRAVDGVSLSLQPGERLGLIGESGSGKSTLALALLRLIRPPGEVSADGIWFDGVDLQRLSDEELRLLRLSEIALVPQGAMNALNPVLRIRPQMVDALRAHGIHESDDAIEQRLHQLFRSVGLPPDVADLYPHQLSGGMKQRVCIATAICLRPKLIIADEPTSALDVVVQRRVILTLRRVQQELGAAVMLIGHDMGLMAQFAQRIAVMRDGKIIEINDVKEIFAHPQHPYTRLLMESLPSLEQKHSIVAAAAAQAVPTAGENARA